MEGLQFETVEKATYNREAVERAAMSDARELIAARGIDALFGVEKFDAMQALMEELAADNDNRHRVEAIAQMLTLARAAHEYHVVSERYPLAS